MEAQMRQAYVNLKKVLAQYGATMENLVDEILFVTNMDAAFAAVPKARKEHFGNKPSGREHHRADSAPGLSRVDD